METSRLGGAAAIPTPQPALLGQLTDRLNCRIGEIVEINQRLEHLANRLVGTQPEAVADKPNKVPDPHSMVDRLERDNEGIEAMLNRTRELVSRLERL